ncbi:hypothetical protein LMK08_03630 [Metapseudomonas furukawaii]|uniref:hypothetical protein n=1 Tax=Metapseudomonas furukawaii TaxID=1149133 RepID=UPI00227BFCCE|nr:hypothetical protein [Pseudomonas furukawaii]WAG79771.1 hypothetical protein LMK08_03630 [Pseudomonas furukawaii]
MLQKLSWEIRQLGISLRKTRESVFAAQGASYHAFNCAVTAWHVVDWAWQEADREMQVALSREGKAGWIRMLTDSCPALAICQALTNNGKHGIGNYGDDMVVMEIHDLRAVPLATGEIFFRYPAGFEIKVTHDGLTYDACDLFNMAGAHLQTVLVKAGLLDGLWRHGYVFDSIDRHDL